MHRLRRLRGSLSSGGYQPGLMAFWRNCCARQTCLLEVADEAVLDQRRRIDLRHMATGAHMA